MVSFTGHREHIENVYDEIIYNLLCECLSMETRWKFVSIHNEPLHIPEIDDNHNVNFKTFISQIQK